jgi:decaprenyl-phosphate phosphoribosyltransferase
MSVGRGGRVVGHSSVTTSRLRAHVRALRPRQWLKNGLVVAVPLAAGSLFVPEVLAAITIAFIVYCMASSSVYLVNDVRDVVEDRAHPTKRHRPVAAGQVASSTALVMAAGLAVVSLSIAFWSSTALGLVIAVYLAIAVAYSYGLKDQPVLDVAVVASGFVLRALAGGVAAGIEVSQWFLLTAAFGSLFMVAGKRFSEALLVGEGQAGSRKSLAGYTVGYLRFMWTLAATLTLVTYAMWSLDVQVGLPRPVLVQVSILPFLLAVLRYAVDIEQGRAGEPEEIILGDKVLQILGVLWIVLFGLGVWDV